MSAFYGQIQGNRGPATRGGSKSSGYKASCQSYDGSVIVEMNYNRNDELMVRISYADHSTAGPWGTTTGFHGTFDELVKMFEAHQKKEDRKRVKKEAVND